jgi:hypothetical protein
MFKHDLGKEAQARVSKLRGIITARSENLYGCNRYYIQPPVDGDGKHRDGWWCDEDDVEVVGEGVSAPRKNNGGPMSRDC